MNNTSTPYPEPDTSTAGGDSPGRRIEAAYLESPGWVTVPRWVQLSGISPLARELAAELVDGANRVHGDMAPTLDREYLAWVVGVSRYDKIARALRELVDIDFLVIYSGGTDRNGNRTHRRDARTGRKLPDTYGIRPNPPESYAGPRNTTEAYELFLRDRESARQRSGNSKRALSIPRQSFTRASAFPLDNPTPSAGGAGAPTTPPAGGTHPETAVHNHTPCEGCGHTPCKGCGDVFPGHAHTPELRVRARRSDRSLLSSVEERRGEIEPVPGGTAEPPATGQDETPSTEALELARRLPWNAWAGERRGRRKPSPEQLRIIARAMDRAVSSGRITWEQATEIGPRALVDAKTWKFVEGAFSEKLDAYLEATIAPASEQLPLPTTEASEHAAEAGRPALTPVSQSLPDCPDCGTPEGGGFGSRIIEDPESGRNVACHCRKAAS